MHQPLSPEQIERLARKRAGAKLGWYMHACIYVLFNLAWFLGAYFGMGHHRWTWFPTIGWGIGVVLHGVSVFVLGSSSGLRERMVARERERLQREQSRLP
ncbi:2TM domain-containing protein [Ramlibacter sp. G-1-2-2]|uniref:2TM domain-containing protein n=1 Tax=Ramlibacter agri TaxID=2728837 RepID=A0A848H2F7_9BURK|nr:2TM domain-containing protein [Ramlibacter agri]NML45005.1 2TM domain-containing protein [Ramlibacter agri]